MAVILGGLWIAFDLLVGTGFACGGWALAWTVYIFNKGKYHALVRPALLASLFGYSLGGLSITIDMGRYLAFTVFLHSRAVQHELCSI